MSLNEFLVDNGVCHSHVLCLISFLNHLPTALGSWADEMDALPSAREYNNLIPRRD